METVKIDAFLRRRLEESVGDRRFAVNIEVSVADWEPPSDVREELCITSRLGTVMGASATSRAIYALSDDPKVVQIEPAF